MLAAHPSPRERHPLELDAPELDELLVAIEDRLEVADPAGRAALCTARRMIVRELARVITEAEAITAAAAA